MQDYYYIQDLLDLSYGSSSIFDFYRLPLGKRWKPASERLAHYSYTFSSGDQFVLIFASQPFQLWYGPKTTLGLDIMIL